ncbi:PAS domain-containing sensor histidine kinase [Anaerovorax odorimutans]|uniref:PAS domain-containing sensor histidine kinase n=1 Tax=Anaerovorax odorimutans TaxID=109327 RepID=UPI00041E1733|nr:ATP-binding protein [Anaerovorax odorimutans]
MKKFYMFYILVLSIYLIPTVHEFYKELTGLFLIMLCSVKISKKCGLYTALLIIIFKVYSFFINSDYDIHTVMGCIISSLLGFLLVFYLGTSADKLKNKNNELHKEIRRRINIEKELNDKISLLQGLMDTIPNPICFKDLNCNYIGCNYAFAQNYGMTENDLIGKGVYEIFDAEQAEMHDKKDKELLKNKGKQAYEIVSKYADGSLRNIILNKTLFKNQYGKPVGVVGVLTDITDQKEREKLKKNIEEEQRIIEEMLRYDRIKTEFFSNISHELRTPINVILGAVQLMEKYNQDNKYNLNPSKIIMNVDRIKLNSLRLLRLVNNLIDITEIDSNSFKIDLKNWDIVNLVENITLSVSEYVNDKGIKLEFDTNVEEKILACDADNIERIMLNLLSNAIKYTKKDGSIYVNLYDKGSYVCIKVKDTGVGIPEGKQNEIFQKFCKINPIFTRPHEGSGIGLSIVKSLVKLHGGKINVESQVGVGSTFTIYLPSRTIKEDKLNRREVLEKQSKIEKIQLEFSDIYYASA